MSIFDNGFKEPEFTFPDKLIIEILKDFENATKNLVSLYVKELDDMERLGLSDLSTTFQYRVVLVSPHLKGYSFEVLRFGYDVSIYPAIITIQSDIGEELNVRQGMFTYKVICQDEESFTKAIEAIFSTDKFKNTVGGLMKIAREKVENT